MISSSVFLLEVKMPKLNVNYTSVDTSISVLDIYGAVANRSDRTSVPFKTINESIDVSSTLDYEDIARQIVEFVELLSAHHGCKISLFHTSTYSKIDREDDEEDEEFQGIFRKSQNFVFKVECDNYNGSTSYNIINVSISSTKYTTVSNNVTIQSFSDHGGVVVLTQLTNKIIEFVKSIDIPAVQKKSIYLVAQMGNRFELTPFSVQERMHQFDFGHYNKGFNAASAKIVDELNSTERNGLVLLHGGAGTGKTSYMKYLLTQVEDKKLIYMPPDMVQHLSSPGFVSFLIANAKKSILLIEDAENILKKREYDQNQSVSNILNISDGILGDIMQIQIVATFNCNIDEIDPALRRPGRLIKEYYFDKLGIEETSLLLKKVYSDTKDQLRSAKIKKLISSNPRMTLAEIYNLDI